jgi:hypothetical protein
MDSTRSLNSLERAGSVIMKVGVFFVLGFEVGSNYSPSRAS